MKKFIRLRYARKLNVALYAQMVLFSVHWCFSFTCSIRIIQFNKFYSLTFQHTVSSCSFSYMVFAEPTAPILTWQIYTCAHTRYSITTMILQIEFSHGGESTQQLTDTQNQTIYLLMDISQLYNNAKYTHTCIEMLHINAFCFHRNSWKIEKEKERDKLYVINWNKRKVEFSD